MKRAVLLLLVFVAGLAVIFLLRRPVQLPPPFPQPPARLSRPAGMAPVAFEAFVRACVRAKIHPWRIGQTLGEHPLSVGYHRKDGFVRVYGTDEAYCAAVDMGVGDLSDRKRGEFLEEMAGQGFAAFYREGGKWTGQEHVHAIYALLPMKPQLRGQVREFLRARRADGKRKLKWEARAKIRWLPRIYKLRTNHIDRR